MLVPPITNDREYIEMWRAKLLAERSPRRGYDVSVRSLAEMNLRLAEYDTRTDAGSRKGDWGVTPSGTRFWLEDPRSFEVFGQDIAHSLARMARYNGWTAGPVAYSVAQHCVVGSYLTCPEVALHFLLHDAPEAYTGDLVTPFKKLLKDEYHRIEAPLKKAIAGSFGIVWSESAEEEVKHVDEVMLVTEVEYLLTHKVIRRPPDVQPCHEIAPLLKPWQPQEAQEKFLNRLRELLDARDN